MGWLTAHSDSLLSFHHFKNLSSSKRKERAKQEKKTRRMEERREEAKRKQECQNLGSPQTNQTLLVIADLEALAI